MREGILLLQKHTEWLYTKIIESDLFLFDLGSFVFFWIGFILFLVLTIAKSKQKWLWFSLIVLLFGIIRYLILDSLFNVFNQDSIKAYVSNIVVCYSGAAISFYFLTGNRFVPGSVFYKRLLALFSTLTFSFLWVGFYQYHYNVNLNTQGLNIWAFSLWTLGGIIFFEGSRRLEIRIDNPYFRILTILSIYYLVLFLIEYLAYYILHIREDSLSNGKPLAFGLIHGTLVLHIYYVSYPLTVYLFYRLLTFVSKKARLELNKSRMYSPQNTSNVHVET